MDCNASRYVRLLPDPEQPSSIRSTSSSSESLPSLNSSTSSLPHDLSETTALLGTDKPYDEQCRPSISIWKQEITTIAFYAAPTMIALVFQSSITVSSIFVAGHLGTNELGAVSLANMSAIVSGYAIFQGFSISLDTLCPQAYGAQNYKLVGLHMQRMVTLLLLVCLPIAVLWWHAGTFLALFIPDEGAQITKLVAHYMRVLIPGLPGYACFEAGKRFVQAQGQFRAVFYVLLICAPINALMSWLFVWKFRWGFTGAPLAISITQSLLPLLLAGYVRFIGGTRCWRPISRSIFEGWLPMIRLALPGALMLEACFLAWEIQAAVTSYIGATELASQSAMASIVSLGYQICLSAAIASGTRVSNHVGAGLLREAKIAAYIAMGLGLLVGSINMTVLLVLKHKIPHLYTADPEVIYQMTAMIPICAGIETVDSLCQACNSILAAVGRPKVASISMVSTHWFLTVPMIFVLAFGFGWKLAGIWVGSLVGGIVAALIELWFVFRIDWDRAAVEARERNKYE